MWKPATKLADLTNADLEPEIADLHTQAYEQARHSSKSRECERHHSRRRSASEIPGIENSNRRTQRAPRRKARRAAAIAFGRPTRGPSHSAARTSRPRQAPMENCPMWSGSPLDEHNLGATLDHGKLFCQIGDPGKFEAVLYVDQADARSGFPWAESEDHAGRTARRDFALP